MKENLNNRSMQELTERSSILKKNPKNAEEAVVPAHGLKRPIDFNTVGEDQF